jgi:uncharacterized membrane-anchored protein
LTRLLKKLSQLDPWHRGDPPEGDGWPDLQCGPWRARADTRTKNLVKRLQRGEVAVINHPDLDSVAARALVQCEPSLVVNAAPSITGRYPNSGPNILLDAGIPLLDNVGLDAFRALQEGDLVTLTRAAPVYCAVSSATGPDAGPEPTPIQAEDAIAPRGPVACLKRGGTVVGVGELLTLESVAHRLAAARENLTVELGRFAENTLERLRNEMPQLLEPAALPPVAVSMADRPVLVVVRGEGFREDLQRVLPYAAEVKPVIIAVDGGADALLEHGLKPDIILGDFDSVTDAALSCGAELIVHAYVDGRAPGMPRLEALGLKSVPFPIAGTSEDAAMLLAFESGADTIVAVGTHFSLVEFLDKGRAGMASTFLVRLKVGSILVDAKGLSRLYQPPQKLRYVAFLMLAALVPIIILFSLSPTLQGLLHTLRLQFQWGHWRRLLPW